MSALNRFHWIVVACLLVTPILIFVAIQSETNTQDVHTWLPNGTVERAEYETFLELFGQDDHILISWPGCNLDDLRMKELTQRLQNEDGVALFFRSVVNGAVVLEELANSQLGVSESAAKRRLANVFLGPDKETTGLILQLSEKGQANRKATLKALLDEVDQVEGLDRQDVRIGGNSYVNAEIDRATNQSLLLSIPAILLCIVITWFCLRSWRLTIITLFVAGLAALTSIAVVTGLGYKINGLLVLMPVLVLVLTLSSCIHLCSYYRTLFNEQNDGSASELAVNTLALGWRPSSMAMLTTSIGILMLSTSHIEAVRHFGWFSALSLVVALVVLLLVYPALLATWPASESEREKWLSGNRLDVGAKNEARLIPHVRWLSFVLLAFVFIAGPLMAMGLGKLETTLSPTKMFPADSGVNRGYSWITDNWTALESVELVAKFPKQQARLVDQLEMVHRIHGAVRKATGISSAYSVTNLSPAVPKKSSFRAITERQTLNEKLEEHLPDLVDQRLIAEDDASRYWRIQLGAGNAGEDGFRELISGIESQVELALDSSEQPPPEIVLTGMWPLSAAGRQQLFDDLAFSFLMAFALITPVVMIVLRGVWVGLVAMIPNVFPALMFFGGLGWMGVSIDIGTILTASVGMGIAVDDTLHFIEWYAREQKKRDSCIGAVRATVAQCARPMFYTTLICSAGLSLFVFSHFIPPRQFAYAIVALLGLALTCDLILLPALIVGPLGFVFRRKTS